jgi:hypothetical protein
VTSDGRVLIADQRNARVRVVDTAGVITTLAGNGDAGYSGDGGLATEATLSWPTSLALDSGGNIFIVDAANGRVRRVDAAGRMTTVAGKGWCSLSGSRGDGGPAVEAAFCTPSGVAVGPDGSLYIAEKANRVRRVNGNGVITTVAGDGWPGCVNCQGRFAGDGGPATEASLNGPAGLAAGKDGSLFIADSGNKRIRRVDSEGMIATIAGNGQEGGLLGSGAPAGEAGLGWPVDVALAADESLYVCDSGNHQVYRVWWRPCDAEAAKARAERLRAKADDSPRLWREVAELYLIAKSWDDALLSAERVLGLTPETDAVARIRAEILSARAYAGKRDDHEARRRLMQVLARANNPALLREAADALVDLYLRRDERDQALATLNDLRLRTQDGALRNWIDRRLKEIGGG